MFDWIPRWHPFKWAVVIILVILVWNNPVGWGHTVGGWIHYIPVIADRIGEFFRSM